MGMSISCCLFTFCSCWVRNANAVSGGIRAMSYVFHGCLDGYLFWCLLIFSLLVVNPQKPIAIVYSFLIITNFLNIV